MCDRNAEWTIVYGLGPEDYTESCSECIGELLTDASEHRLYPFKNINPDFKGIAKCCRLS
jgi:hypothetical protein